MNCQSWVWLRAFAVSELLPRMKTNKHDNTFFLLFLPLMMCFCLGHSHVNSIIGGRVLKCEGQGWTQRDVGEVETHLCVLTTSAWVRANEFCVFLNHNGALWEQFIWLKIKGIRGVSPLGAKILKSTEEFSFYPFSWCLNTDGASDDAGMMEWRTDAKESKLSKTDILNATYTLYFSHTDMAECKYHCYASPTIEKEFSFLLSNHSSEYPLSYLPRPLR